MTFLKSLFNRNMFKESIKQQKYVILLHTILLFMITTMPSIIIKNKINNIGILIGSDKETLVMLLSGLSPYVMILLTAAGIITSILLYNYFYKKQSMLFYNSMPISRGCMYITRLISGFVAILIPLVLIYVVNTVIYCSYGLLSTQPFSIIIKGFTTVALMYLCVLSVASFGASVSGNFFAQLIVIAFVFLVYPVSTFITMISFDAWFSKLSIAYNYNVLYFFPPAMLANYKFNGFKLFDYIYVILYSAVFIAMGLILFKHRKSENSSKFFAYSKIMSFLKYYVTFFACLIFGSVFFGASDGGVVISYIGYILTAFLSFVIIQGIFGKNFKSMFTNMKNFAIFAVLICIVISLPVINPHIIENHTPDPQSLNKISVNIYNGYNNSYDLKDKKNIESAMKLLSCKDNSDTTNEKEYYYRNDVGVEIVVNPDSPLFTLRYRNNGISISDYNNYIKDIYDTKEYKNIMLDNLNVKNEYRKDVTLTKHQTYVMEEDSGILNKEKIDKLIAAFKEDFQNYNYDKISNSYVYAILNVYGVDFKVYDCYKKTIEIINNDYLKEICFDSSDMNKLEINVWSNKDNSDKTIYETNDKRQIEEILKYCVGYGNTLDVIIVDSIGREYNFGVNYDNLPSYVKNTIENK